MCFEKIESVNPVELDRLDKGRKRDLYKTFTIYIFLLTTEKSYFHPQKDTQSQL